MKYNNIVLVCLVSLCTALWPGITSLTVPEAIDEPTDVPLQDLSFFESPSKSWSVASDVYVNLNESDALNASQGNGILVNRTSKKDLGSDLFSKISHGDLTLELDFLLPVNGNSGIYLQGRYEVQLADSWYTTQPTSASNGGIYNLSPPRTNASKAPGLWQRLKVVFKAPRFNSSGQKVENARFLQVELNGVIVQENVEVFTPTPGAVSDKEVAMAPLRIQGDHGSVAFRNIKITRTNLNRAENSNLRSKDPIYVDALETKILRSFINLPNNEKVVHAVSVGSPQQVHYTYDLDNGSMAQVWRGGFLDATPMWDNRGNGTSLPRGAIQQLGERALFLTQLNDINGTWPADTAGTFYRPKGYKINSSGEPHFNYQIHGYLVEDHIAARTDGKGIDRSVAIQNPANIYARLAVSDRILEKERGHYIIGDKEYYLNINNPKQQQAFIRKVQDKFELLVLVKDELRYSILF